jgi:UMF1 family MFS transporter
MTETSPPAPALAAAASRRALVAWCLYDWANSAFPTVIGTFVFATYFTQAVAPTPELGTAWWGWTLSSVGLVIAISGPLLGAAADEGGQRKPWLLGFTALCVVVTAALWAVQPSPADVVLALVLMAVGNLGFELAIVYYNAMLPDLAGKEMVGRLSGWGWGLGYAGGLACLVLALVAFVQADRPLFGLDKAAAEHVRATGPLVAVWMAIFAVPLFLWTPDRPSRGIGLAAALKAGTATVWGTLVQMRRYRQIVLFLVARMIYTNGLNTLFAFGGIYAAGSFGMSFAEVIWFGISLNLTAGLGAAAFGVVDDRIGGKPTVIISLVSLIGLGTAILLVESKSVFWALGLGIGVFVGPAQSASRSLMARLAPPEMTTEMFGLYALSGKATAFLGPALLGWATLAFSSQRAGMATILLFFALGLVLLLPIREPRP